MTISQWRVINAEQYPDLINQCAICQNAEQDLVLVHHNASDERIQHVFHRKCVRKCLFATNSQSCAMCREKIEVGQLLASSSIKRINDTALVRIGFGIVTAAATMGLGYILSEGLQDLPLAFSAASVLAIVVCQYLQATKTIPGAMSIPLFFIGMGIIGKKLLARDFDDSLVTDASDIRLSSFTKAAVCAFVGMGFYAIGVIDYLADAALQKILIL